MRGDWLDTIHCFEMPLTARQMDSLHPYVFFERARKRALTIHAKIWGVCPALLGAGDDGGCWRPLMILREGEHLGKPKV